MTFALAIKVNDGLVLAADSATTLQVSDDPNHVIVYNNANKIVNLHRDIPISLMTWGLGNIGPDSIATISKDLRLRFQGDNPDFLDWKLDPSNFKVAGVAQKVADYFHLELGEAVRNGQTISSLGLFIGGYSPKEKLVDAYGIETNGLEMSGPNPIFPDQVGMSWWGQPEAISRLVLGFSSKIEWALQNLGVSPEATPGYVEALKAQVATPLVHAPMPIQDAIDLAEFLVDTSIKFTKFNLGHNTVGGPIEIAAVTRHEGYKWIARKHYYNRDINPSGIV